MKTMKIDHTILQKETDKFLDAIAAYRKAVLAQAPRISESFKRQAGAMDILVGQFVDSLQPVVGKTIVDIINANNSMMLLRPYEKGDFGIDPLDSQHERFIDLTDRTYAHVPAKGFMDDVDDKKTAKSILRDYVDATVIFYGIVGRKAGMDVSPVMIEAFVNKAHEFITQDRGTVVQFAPGQRPK